MTIRYVVARQRVHLIALVFAVVLPTRIVAQVEVRLPDLRERPGSSLAIPLVVGDLTGKNITAFEFVVTCDSTVLELEGVDQKGTLSEGLTMFANNRVAPYNKSRMKVVCASARPIEGKGTLVRIMAKASKKAGTSMLSLSHVVMNAGLPQVRSIDGSVQLVKGLETKKKRVSGKRE